MSTTLLGAAAAAAAAARASPPRLLLLCERLLGLAQLSLQGARVDGLGGRLRLGAGPGGDGGGGGLGVRVISMSFSWVVESLQIYPHAAKRPPGVLARLLGVNLPLRAQPQCVDQLRHCLVLKDRGKGDRSEKR